MVVAKVLSILEVMVVEVVSEADGEAMVEADVEVMVGLMEVALVDVLVEEVGD